MSFAEFILRDLKNLVAVVNGILKNIFLIIIQFAFLYWFVSSNHAKLIVIPNTLF